MLPAANATSNTPETDNPPEAAAAAEHQFYPAPPSWFGKHVGPWLLFLPISGALGYFWQAEPHSFWAHAGFALAQAFLVWALYLVLTDKSVTCLTIGPEQVSLEEGGRTTILLYTEIRGFSEKHSKEGSFLLVEALDKGNPSISISHRFPDYVRIRELLGSHVTDFDAPERERHERALAIATEVLLQDPRLGPSTGARKAALGRAWGTVAWLTIAAVPLGFWLAIRWPYDLVMPLGLAVPLLALAALWGYRGSLVRFAGSQDDPRPDVLLAVGIPSVMLLLGNSFAFSFLSWRPLLPAAGGIAALFALVLLAGSGWGTGPGESPLKQVGLGLLFAVCYGLGASVVYNCAFEGAAVTRRPAYVNDKYRTTGKGSSNYLITNLTEPNGTHVQVTVSSDYYAHKQINDSLTVRLHRGRLGAYWTTVAGDE